MSFSSSYTCRVLSPFYLVILLLVCFVFIFFTYYNNTDVNTKDQSLFSLSLSYRYQDLRTILLGVYALFGGPTALFSLDILLFLFLLYINYIVLAHIAYHIGIVCGYR